MIAALAGGHWTGASMGFWIAGSALCYLDFAIVRQTFCKYLCPYARFQSVLLDSDSLVVAYDTGRGEPRGKMRRDGERGDCVDCGLCVAICPTDIDIRQGLQMECIGCTQCIDACDGVMTRVGRPTGLIAYRSLAAAARGSSHAAAPRARGDLRRVAAGGRGRFGVALADRARSRSRSAQSHRAVPAARRRSGSAMPTRCSAEPRPPDHVYRIDLDARAFRP
jgi:polyferredoxin